jgi:membrane-associated phospholipid phosphatase
MALSHKRTLWIILPFIFCIFGATAIVVFGMNSPLFLSINDLSSYTGTWIWANLTIFGDTLVFVVLFLPLVRKIPQIIYAMLIALIVSTLLVQIPKHLFDIPRPTGIFEKESITVIGPAYKYNAFPSGHAATIFCLYILLLQFVRSQIMRSILLLTTVILALSRIVVGIHWPLDVTAGAAIGILSGYIAIYLINSYLSKIPDILYIILTSLLIVSAIVLLIAYNTYYEQAFWLQRFVAAICLATGIPEYIKLIKYRIH